MRKYSHLLLIVVMSYIIIVNLSFNTTDSHNYQTDQKTTPFGQLGLNNAHLGYEYSGGLTNNGDEFIDDEEYAIYEFDVKSGENLILQLELSNNFDVWFAFFNGDGIDDFLNAFNKAYSAGDSSDLYAFNLTIDGKSSIEYKANRRTKGSVVILLPPEATTTSTNFLLKSSIPTGDRADFVEDTLPRYILIGIFVIGVIVFLRLVVFSKKDPNRQFYPDPYMNSNQSYSNNPRDRFSQNNPSQQPQSQRNEPIKPSYLAYDEPYIEPNPEPVDGQFIFCVSCGQKNTLDSNYCQACGFDLKAYK